MRFAGYIILALAIVHLLFAAFGGLTEGLAEGHSIWERALLLLVHPAGAAAVCKRCRGRERVLGHLQGRHRAFKVARPLVFAVIPVLGLAYGIVLRAGRTKAGA